MLLCSPHCFRSICPLHTISNVRFFLFYAFSLFPRGFLDVVASARLYSECFLFSCLFDRGSVCCCLSCVALLPARKSITRLAFLLSVLYMTGGNRKARRANREMGRRRTGMGRDAWAFFRVLFSRLFSRYMWFA